MSMHPAVAAFRGGPDLIRVVGHRGARGLLPENTMIGFEFALTTGVPLLEFDVVLTADLVPVITHNHHLHAPTFRGSDGQFVTAESKVAEMTVAELQRFDVGRSDGNSAYGQRFPDQAQLDNVHVPRLSDLLARVAEPRFSIAHLMLEMKSDPATAHDPAHRRRLVERVVAEVRAAGLTERTLLHSFDWRVLDECADQAPDMPRSFLTEMPENRDSVGEDSAQDVAPDFVGRESEIPGMVHDRGGALWCPYVHDVTAETVKSAHSLGLVVAVWTVNTPEDIGQMIDYGVDAIVSDYPGRVQRILADRGFRWLD